MIKNLSSLKKTNKQTDKNLFQSDCFTNKFYQTFKDEMKLTLKQSFPKNRRASFPKILPNPLYEAIITLIPKPKKDSTHKKITDQYLS